MRQWLLEKFEYKIGNISGDNNKWSCNIDLVLMSVYALVSLFNAVKLWIPTTVLDFLGISSGSVPTISVIVINCIVLARLHIGIYIKLKDSKKAELKRLAKRREIVEDISINAWKTRIWIIYIAYIVDVIIGMFYFVYRTYVEKCLAVIIIVTILSTIFNNFLDNTIMRFEATPKIYKYNKEA